MAADTTTSLFDSAGQLTGHSQDCQHSHQWQLNPAICR
jgi:hypothetical protein